MTKDELRAELERQAQRYQEVYGGEVTLYAAQPEPERKPWKKRKSLLDEAFQNSRPSAKQHEMRPADQLQAGRSLVGFSTGISFVG